MNCGGLSDRYDLAIPDHQYIRPPTYLILPLLPPPDPLSTTTVAMADNRPPTENQLAKRLPGVTAYVTGHTADGKSELHSKRPVAWDIHDEDQLCMSVAWTASFPPVSRLYFPAWGLYQPNTVRNRTSTPTPMSPPTTPRWPRAPSAS